MELEILKMGKKRSNKDIDILTEVFKNGNPELIYDQESNSIFPRKNEIREKISTDLRIKWLSISALSLFTSVSKNYYNLWEILNIKNVNDSFTSVLSDNLSDVSNTITDSDCSRNDNENINFNIIFTRSELDSFS